MRRFLTFVTGLGLALIFAGASVSALAITFLTVKDALESNGSLETFEAHIRHYSDRLVMDETGIYMIRAPHPFAYHFGMLALCWVVAVLSFVGLRYLLRAGRERDSIPDSPTG